MRSRFVHQVVGVVVVGFAILVALTAIQVADVPPWVTILTRLGIALDGAAAGLLINRLVVRRRRRR